MAKPLPADLIPEEYAELLPVCPCGCESRLAEDYSLFHADPPQYVLQGYKEHGLSWIDTERRIIRNREWVEHPVVHRMRHLKLLLPWMTHDPNLVRFYQRAQILEGKNIKIHSLMGHASSGKTNYMVTRGFTSIDIWPDHSEVFVAAPTMVSGKYLLWREFNKCYEKMLEHGYRVGKQGNVFTIVDRVAGPGTILFVGVHNIQTLRGKKMVDQNRGELLVELDEVGEFPNDAILRIIANLRSQKGLRVVSGTNFRDLHGMDGRFHEPQGCEWTELDRELDYEWPTVLGGWSTRNRAAVSPNMVMKQDYYDYLLTEQAHQDYLGYGVNSPDYLSQADAFPTVESISNTLISMTQIQGGNAFDDIDITEPERWGFVDPSFTYGGDGAVGVCMEYGYSAMEGQKIRAVNATRLNVHERQTWNEELLSLAREFRGNRGLKPTIKLGERVEVYDLCALRIAQWARQYRVDFSRLGYDDSMRGELVQSVVYFLGEGPTAYYYGRQPDGRVAFPLQYKWVKHSRNTKAQKVPKTNQDLHKKFVSQMWLTTVNMVKAGYLRNCGVLEAAMRQMTGRLKEQSTGDKVDVEPKQDYKERNARKSPDEADAACGCVNMIVEKRISPSLPTSGVSVSGDELTAVIMAQVSRKRKPRVPQLSR